MIITCPNCQTSYQVADTSIGSAGRKVMCAHCHRAWQATAELPRPQPVPEPGGHVQAAADGGGFVDDAEEEALDKAFEDQERADGASGWARDLDETGDEHSDADGPEPVDAKEQKSRLLALNRRQKKLAMQSPLGRLKRAARWISLFVLAGVLVVGVGFRNELVRAYPELGGVYDGLGLRVNVIGLTFSQVETERALRDGVDVLQISAVIENVSNGSRRVPPVLVSILDAQGTPLYEWQAKAQADTVGLGDAVAFKTRLNSAPKGAKQVRLTFANDGEGAAKTIEKSQQGSK